MTVIPAKPSAQPATADDVIAVDNPADGMVIGHVPDSSPTQVREAVARARRTQPAWQALDFAGRRRHLDRARIWLLDHREEILDSIVAENGKPREDAIVEIAYCAAALKFWATKASRYLGRAKIRTLSPFVLGRALYTTRSPVGVVGVIGPWNNPIINSFGDAIPALAAGNAVVLKPSEETPLTAVLMQRMADECGWPAGVFQVVTGRGETGAALVDEVDFVMFTGSTRTGRAVASQAARRLVPCSLELGGKDALIVLADADLRRAANVAVQGAMSNSGQMCTSVERVYVEESVHDAFVEEVTTRVRALRVGRSGDLGSVEIGAMTFPAQLDIVREHLDDAVARGARIIVGGGVQRDAGRFIEPTVLVDVDHTMRCMREETFGPTLPIMRVADAAEAVRLANESEYGLQASIATRDMRRARMLADQLDVGCVTINDAQSNYMALGLPMGGWKSSGLGIRHGAEGIRKYTRLKAVMVNGHPLRRDIHMMPFDPKAYRRIMQLVTVLYGRHRRS